MSMLQVENLIVHLRFVYPCPSVFFFVVDNHPVKVYQNVPCYHDFGYDLGRVGKRSLVEEREAEEMSAQAWS